MDLPKPFARLICILIFTAAGCGTTGQQILYIERSGQS